MLRKKYRLGSKQRIKINKSIPSDYFLLRIGKNDLPFCRFRFVISKKVDKKAVVRNKLKRIFIGCIEKLPGDLKEGHDFIFITKSSVIGVNKEQICFSIKETFKKEGLIK